jgi:hypothetical protein
MPDQRVTAQQRQFVGDRAKGCCEYCQSQLQFSPQPFSVEHIQPRSMGGITHADNLALSCSGCNGHKYNKTHAIDPVTGESVPLFHPRQQQWVDHFGWDQGYTQVIGLTPTGRATVDALRLNRPALQNLRELLFAAGKHPPE